MERLSTDQSSKTRLHDKRQHGLLWCRFLCCFIDTFHPLSASANHTCDHKNNVTVTRVLCDGITRLHEWSGRGRCQIIGAVCDVGKYITEDSSTAVRRETTQATVQRRRQIV